MTIKEILCNMKEQSYLQGLTPIETRNQAIMYVIEALKENNTKIFHANEIDLGEAHKKGISQSIIGRLKFDNMKLEVLINGLCELTQLPDPLFQISLARQLDEGLTLYRKSSPIGVIGIIFEARPDALVQISALCIKSGNCAILKGGSETKNTNQVLFQLIIGALERSGISRWSLYQVEEREEISELLKYDEYVDLIIPRGSNKFVQYIMDHTKIPVLGHADGKCTIFVDESADFMKAIKIIIDSKIQYAAVCNAVETILIHKKIAKDFLVVLEKKLCENNVKIRGSDAVAEYIDCEVVDDAELNCEYLDYIISIQIVEDVNQAIRFINTYGSHHTDCVIGENKETVDKFMKLVDSSGVFHNCSTRFSDGYRYGFGAEVGVSTQKIHARGPVGLEGLVTYKYELYGDGHIVDDYVMGRKKFHYDSICNNERY